MLLALLVQILAPAGAQISMARAMPFSAADGSSGAALRCAPGDFDSSSAPDHSGPAHAACCALCGLIHAGVAPPAPAPQLAARAAPQRIAPQPPVNQHQARAPPRTLRPPARASPSV